MMPVPVKVRVLAVWDDCVSVSASKEKIPMDHSEGTGTVVGLMDNGEDIVTNAPGANTEKSPLAPVTNVAPKATEVAKVRSGLFGV